MKNFFKNTNRDIYFFPRSNRHLMCHGLWCHARARNSHSYFAKSTFRCSRHNIAIKVFSDKWISLDVTFTILYSKYDFFLFMEIIVNLFYLK